MIANTMHKLRQARCRLASLSTIRLTLWLLLILTFLVVTSMAFSDQENIEINQSPIVAKPVVAPIVSTSEKSKPKKNVTIGLDEPKKKSNPNESESVYLRLPRTFSAEIVSPPASVGKPKKPTNSIEFPEIKTTSAEIPQQDSKVQSLPFPEPIFPTDPPIKLKSPQKILPPPTPEGIPKSNTTPLAQSDDDNAEPKPSPLPPDQAILLGAARAAARQGKWEDALKRFEEFFRRYGDYETVRQEYAGILIEAGKIEEGTQEYQRLLEKNPKNPRLRVLLGDVHMLNRQFRQAISEYQQALNLKQEDKAIATKLARAYVLAKQVRQGLKIYDLHLNELKPTDAKVPDDFPGLLIDLAWYRESLPFLLAQQKKQPTDLDILSLLIRAYAGLNDFPSALETLKLLASQKNNRGVMQNLGEQLLSSQHFEIAMQVFQQLLNADSENKLARLGVVRVHLELYQPREAVDLLKTIKPDDATERLFYFTWAQFHQHIGEYAEAVKIYLKFLHQDRNDDEARLALGKLLAFISEHEKALSHFSSIPITASQSTEARIEVVNTLREQWKVDEAAMHAEKLAIELPEDGDVIAAYVRALGKARQLSKAMDVAHSYLALNKRNLRGSFPVRLALGRVLRDAGKRSEAAVVYKELAMMPNGTIPAVRYGLIQSSTPFGGPDILDSLRKQSLLPTEGMRDQILLADEFYNDNADEPTISLLHEVLSKDPQNLAALIRIADAQLRVARFTGNIDSVISTTSSILNLSPTNTRGHLTQARAMSTVQRYMDAVIEYDKLIILDPSFRIPRREKARVLYSDHEFGATDRIYHQLQFPEAGAVLKRQLHAYVLDKPQFRDLLKHCLVPNISGDVVAAELAKANKLNTDVDSKNELHRILMSYQAQSKNQSEVYLEANGKRLNGWKNYKAVPIYQSSIATEPDNTESLFDLSQVFGGLKQTMNATLPLGQLLEVEPQHREAMIALERAGLEMGLQIHTDIEHFNQEGRDGLAEIGSTKYGTAVQLPLGDENEYVRLGFHRINYEPVDDRDLDGNILSLRTQKKFFNSRLLLHGQVNAEHYEDRFSTRLTFDIGAAYDVSDCLRLSTSGFLNNVAQNGESLRQDIYRGGVNFGADIKASRYWNFGGNYRFAHYSDDNDLNEIFLYNDIALSLPPKQLKIVNTLNFLAYSEQTIFPFENQNVLFGTIHPYFAPEAFVYYETRLEWYHWLSRDYFTYSNQCWYSLQYGIGWDDSINMYHDFRGIVNWDVKSWLTIGAESQALLSRVYDAVSVRAFLILRFPFCLY